MLAEHNVSQIHTYSLSCSLGVYNDHLVRKERLSLHLSSKVNEGGRTLGKCDRMSFPTMTKMTEVITTEKGFCPFL